MKMLRDGLRPEVASELYTAVVLAKFRKKAHILRRKIGNAGMIIEFDSIRTACELGNRVCATLDFGGMGIQSAAFLAQW